MRRPGDYQGGWLALVVVPVSAIWCELVTSLVMPFCCLRNHTILVPAAGVNAGPRSSYAGLAVEGSGPSWIVDIDRCGGKTGASATPSSRPAGPHYAARVVALWEVVGMPHPARTQLDARPPRPPGDLPARRGHISLAPPFGDR